MLSGELVNERDPCLWPPSSKQPQWRLISTWVTFSGYRDLGIRDVFLLLLSPSSSPPPLSPPPSGAGHLLAASGVLAHLLPPAPVSSPASSQGMPELSLGGYTECILSSQINSSRAVTLGHVSQGLTSSLVPCRTPFRH